MSTQNEGSAQVFGIVGDDIRDWKTRQLPAASALAGPGFRAEAAEIWCEAIGRAVATGRLPASRGQAAMRAVSEWRAAREAGVLEDQIEELEEMVGSAGRTK